MNHFVWSWKDFGNLITFVYVIGCTYYCSWKLGGWVIDKLKLDSKASFEAKSHYCNGSIDIVKCCPVAHGAPESECNCGLASK